MIWINSRLFGDKTAVTAGDYNRRLIESWRSNFSTNLRVTRSREYRAGVRAVLSLGSNLGDRLSYLQLAVDELARLLVAVSSVYETKPWGVTDQPDFLNAVVIAESAEFDEWAWLHLAQRCEQLAERRREQRWGPRTLDVDVVTVDSPEGSVRSDHPDLLLPHPGAHARPTVLVPWLEVDPEAVLLGHGSVRELFARQPADELDGVRRRSDLRLEWEGS